MSETANRQKPPTSWLSYGGGVNSTALLIGLLDGRVQASPWRVVFADTRDERPETYDYIDNTIRPWLRKHGVVLEVCCASEGVLERWERLSVCGSRTLRTCTVEAKINPITRHINAHGRKDDIQMIGIHAGEAHRAKPARDGERTLRFPLVELGWGQEECEQVIKDAGLPVPVKSGCWHCPFLRKAEVISLANNHPCSFQRIVDLEDAANKKHPGHPRTQWGDKPARAWRDGGMLFADASNDLPCSCWDGDESTPEKGGAK